MAELKQHAVHYFCSTGLSDPEVIGQTVEGVKGYYRSVNNAVGRLATEGQESIILLLIYCS